LAVNHTKPGLLFLVAGSFLQTVDDRQKKEPELICLSAAQRDP
jgi:hypothetical protein